MTGIATEFGYNRHCNRIWIWQVLQHNLDMTVIATEFDSQCHNLH